MVLAKAVFIDKDGTLIENIPFNSNPDHIRFLDGAAEAVRQFHEAGYLNVVVTNQPGIAMGFFPINALLSIEKRLQMLFASAGSRMDGFYACPHHPRGKNPLYSTACSCRKPKPGLLYQAAEDLLIDLRQSWLIGDILDDVEAGRRAGCQTIFLDVGNETEWNLSMDRKPHFIVNRFSDAARILLNVEKVYH